MDQNQFSLEELEYIKGNKSPEDMIGSVFNTNHLNEEQTLDDIKIDHSRFNFSESQNHNNTAPPSKEKRQSDDESKLIGLDAGIKNTSNEKFAVKKNVKETITKHTNSTFYYSVEPVRRNNAKLNDRKKRRSRWKQPNQKQNQQKPKLNYSSAAAPTQENQQKRNVTETSFQRLFGGNRKQKEEKEAIKNFRRFEEDLLRMMRRDEEDNWRCVVLPTNKKTPNQENSTTRNTIDQEKQITVKENHTLITNEPTFQKVEVPDNLREKNFKYLLQRNSEENKNEEQTKDKKNDKLNLSNNSLETDSEDEDFNTIKHESKFINFDSLGLILDEQEKEQNWKSVILTEEQLQKIEENKAKLRKQKEMNRKELENHYHDSDNLFTESIAEKLELTVKDAFVVDDAAEDSRISSSNSMHNLSEKITSRLHRSSSARFSSKRKTNIDISGTSIMTKRTSPSSNSSLTRKAIFFKNSQSTDNEKSSNANNLNLSNYEQEGNKKFLRSQSSKKDVLNDVIDQTQQGNTREDGKSTGRSKRLLKKAASLFLNVSPTFKRKEKLEVAEQQNSADDLDQSRASSSFDNLENLWRDGNTLEERQFLRRLKQSDKQLRRSRSWGITGENAEQNLETSESSCNSMDHLDSTVVVTSTSSSRGLANGMAYNEKICPIITPATSDVNRANRRHALGLTNNEKSTPLQNDVKKGITLPNKKFITRSQTNVNVHTRWKNENILQAQSLPSINATSEVPTSKSISTYRTKTDKVNEPNLYKNMALRHSIAISDISPTLHIAEEDSVPLKSEFNKMQLALLLQRQKASKDNNNHIEINYMEKNYLNKNSQDERIKDLEKNFKNGKTQTSPKQYVNETNFKTRIHETKSYGIFEKYRKVLEVQHSYSSPSIPYIAVAKSTGKPYRGRNDFYTSDSNAECMNVYSNNGKLKLSISVPGCPRGLTAFTQTHVISTSCFEGHIYVIDVVRGRIVRKIGHRTILKNPRYVTMHPGNRAYVTSDIRSIGDWNLNMFDLRSGFVTALAPSNQQRGNMKWPGFLNFRSETDQLYISDSESNCVFMYDVRNTKEPVLKFGRAGNGDGELENPCGIAFTKEDFQADRSSENVVAVADWGNNRISGFDAITGEFQGHLIENIANKKIVLETPYDLASDEMGCLYVTESETNSIKLFSLQ